MSQNWRQSQHGFGQRKFRRPEQPRGCREGLVSVIGGSPGRPTAEWSAGSWAWPGTPHAPRMEYQAWLNPSPSLTCPHKFVEPRRRDQAPSRAKRGAERWLLGQGLGAGVEGAVGDLGLRRPAWDQPPAHVDHLVAPVGGPSDDRDALRRRDVVTGAALRERGAERRLDPVEPRARAGEPAAHRSMLAEGPRRHGVPAALQDRDHYRGSWVSRIGPGRSDTQRSRRRDVVQCRRSLEGRR